ncbi:hypothetical protein SAMN05421781_0346 [Marinococcus luteus]|uniref:Uncharacterized protein n=1 Tax=Marinococcus luteus TaxID=1122204 RepID=A0A1H2QJA0_9BACI|nr:hypothetical protein [Marinococcus luteus]SDW07242.1 hypothetical protein SAMN05421781_0346 [Marinococcus luteus]
MSLMNESVQENEALDQTIIQTIGYREALIHYELYRRYQQAIERDEMFSNNWFQCSTAWLRERTNYSDKEIKTALRKLRRKKWIQRVGLKGQVDPLYLWFDDSLQSILATVPIKSKNIYYLLLEEYRHLNSFHNYIIHGWFEYSIKRLSDETDMFYFEIRPYLKKLKKHQLIEQKKIGQVNYFRLTKKR